MDVITIKDVVFIYGLILCVFAGIFWYLYHRNIKGIPIIPITSIVVFGGFFSMLILMVQNDIIKTIFGNENQIIRTNILNILGPLFTGFILIITITWGLIATGQIENIQKRVYFQSYLMVGLFIYIAAAFYSILASLQ